MDRRVRLLAMCAVGFMVTAGCSGSSGTVSTTTTVAPEETDLTTENVPSTDTTPVPSATDQVETGEGDDPPALDDVDVSEWQPATRTDEILAALSSTDQPTLQMAVDAFDVTVAPMPGATASDLPDGPGIGGTSAMMLIQSARDQLTTDQRAVLDALEASVTQSVLVADDADAPTDSTTLPGVAGFRAPSAGPVFDRYVTLMQQAQDDWKAAKPSFPRAPVRVQFTNYASAKGEMVTTVDPVDPRACRIQVMQPLWSTEQTDEVIKFYFAHELFHCVQFQWGFNDERIPDWLIEGSAEFAASDLYRDVFAMPDVQTYFAWWTDPEIPLADRAYSAWGLWESHQRWGGDSYSAVKAMVPKVLDSTDDYLAAGSMTNLDFRMRWSSYDLRSTAFGEQEWRLPWVGPDPDRGPFDNRADGGVRGVGAYQVFSAGKFAQQQVAVQMSADVGLVSVVPTGSTMTTHSASGTVTIADMDLKTFCFRDDHCACPQGRTSNAVQMDGREMIFSFAAQRAKPHADVSAVKWDPTKYCDKKKKQTAQHNGDPHLVSFDGLHFDVMAQGEFVVARDAAGGFEVQARHQAPVGGTSVTSLAMGTGDHRISLTGDLSSGADVVVRVDGDTMQLTEQATMVGDVELSFADGRWDALWPDGSEVEVFWNLGFFTEITVSEQRAPTIDGLLGTPNGNFLDDLLDADGHLLDPDAPLALDDRFAPRWAVDDTTTLFDYEPGQSTATFRRPRPTPPPPPSDQVIALCKQQLGDKATPYELQSCEYDIAATGDDSFADAYASVVTSRVANLPQSAPAVLRGSAKPSPNAPAAGSSTLTLSGTLASDVIADQPDVKAALDGTIDVAEGSVIFGRVDDCHPDVEIRLRLTSRDGGQRNEVALCDPFRPPPDTSLIGQGALWVTNGGTYDISIISSSQEPTEVGATVYTDPEPTIIQPTEAQRDGFDGEMSGVGDTVVLLTQTGDDVYQFDITGLDDACAEDVYGADALGEGIAWVLEPCEHTTQFFVPPTGSQVVPIVIYSRDDTPLDLVVRPTKT